MILLLLLLLLHVPTTCKGVTTTAVTSARVHRIALPHALLLATLPSLAPNTS